jgi:hypothetical protein
MGIYCDEVQKSISQVRRLKFNLSKSDVTPDLGLEDVSSIFNSVNVYPNPSNGLLNIQSDVQLDKIELLNSNGQVVRKLTLANDISDLSNGIYFVRLQIGTYVEIRKVVKN